MESLIILLFYVVQFVIGAIAYRRWMRNQSQLDAAKTRVFESVMGHYQDGTLTDYLEEIVSRKSPLLPSRPALRSALLCGGALFIGLVFMYALIKIVFPGLHLVFRAIITFVAVTPFVVIAFIGIAQEVDDMRILDFARSIRERLTRSMEDQTTEQAIQDLIVSAKKS